MPAVLFIKLVDKEDIHNILDVFEFWPHWTTELPALSIQHIMGKMVCSFLGCLLT